MKRLGTIGLKTKYSDDEIFKRWVHRIFALSLCPLNQIDEQFQVCLETKPDVLRVDEFLDYIVVNYFEGSFYLKVAFLSA